MGGLGFCWWGEVVFEDFLFLVVFVCFAQQGGCQGEVQGGGAGNPCSSWFRHLLDSTF